MLSTLAQHYKKEGYCIVPNLLPLTELANTVFEIDMLVVQQLQRLGETAVAADTIDCLYAHMDMLYVKSQSVYLQVLRLWPKLYSMHQLVMHKNILATMRELGIALPIFQTEPVMHVMSSKLKITGGYHGVGVHQDWPALQSGLDTITLWFPFMDVDKNNFPVEIIPGSHVNGLYPGTAADNIYEIDPNSYNEKDFIPMEVNCGDVLFMSNFLLHRSGTRGDHRLRAACSARYENASEKSFIDRVYPSAQKRVIQRELLQPNFPVKEQLEELFLI